MTAYETSVNKFCVPKSLIRSVGSRRGFFDISGCKIPTDNEIPRMDGVLVNAVWYSDEEIAEFMAYYEQLENVETLLGEWIKLRRSRTRKAREKPKQFQKQEAVK